VRSLGLALFWLMFAVSLAAAAVVVLAFVAVLHLLESIADAALHLAGLRE